MAGFGSGDALFIWNGFVGRGTPEWPLLRLCRNSPPALTPPYNDNRCVYDNGYRANRNLNDSDVIRWFIGERRGEGTPPYGDLLIKSVE